MTVDHCILALQPSKLGMKGVTGLQTTKLGSGAGKLAPDPKPALSGFGLTWVLFVCFDLGLLTALGCP